MMAVLPAALRLVVLASISTLASSSVTAQEGVYCVDKNSAEGLTMAVDAAIMELQGKKGWFHELKTTSGYNDALGVYSCTPPTDNEPDRWEYPLMSDAKGALERVLTTGKLKVAGVKWSQVGAADYVTDPENPTGFWVDYIKAIADTMAAHYGVPIAVERMYYADSGLVVSKVADGEEVDMSEPYYYLSGFHLDMPRIETHAFSCVTAGTESFFYTMKGGGIDTLDKLYNAIVAGVPNRDVGFIAEGNYDSVSAVLPPSTNAHFYKSNASDIAARVKAGSIVAGYSSEGMPPDEAEFDVFPTGVISPRVALFHKDDYTCHSVTPRGDDDELTASLVVVAVIALLLAILLAIVIARECQNRPLFTPLVKSTAVTVEAVKPSLSTTSAAATHAP